jgi:hypothetical protein
MKKRLFAVGACAVLAFAALQSPSGADSHTSRIYLDKGQIQNYFGLNDAAFQGMGLQAAGSSLAGWSAYCEWEGNENNGKGNDNVPKLHQSHHIDGVGASVSVVGDPVPDTNKKGKILGYWITFTTAAGDAPPVHGDPCHPAKDGTWVVPDLGAASTGELGILINEDMFVPIP